jgi:hypothetical protein
MLIIRRHAHKRFGRRYGNRPKMPVLENVSGNEVLGSANVPPIAGPIIVPIDHTKGRTEYARAIIISKCSLLF